MIVRKDQNIKGKNNMETLLMILGIIVLSLMCISFLGSITATFLFYRAITQEDKQSD